YTFEEVIGLSAVLLHPVDRQGEERLILERLHRGERIEPYETVRVSKSGQRIDVSLTVSPIFDAGGRVIGASKIVRDITAKKRAEQRLIMQNGVTRALAESPTLSDAAGEILRAINEPLGWDVGAIWYVGAHERLLRCSSVWHNPSIQIPHFEAVCRELTLQPGIGLPGRVWSGASAAWIPDVTKDDNFPRAAI